MTDLKTVEDFNEKRKLEILKGQCLNIVGNSVFSINFNEPIEVKCSRIIENATVLFQRLKDAEFHTKY